MPSTDTATYRETCRACLRPESACWCRHLVRVPSRTKVVFLQHPREWRHAIGTARMANLSLPGSELHVGADFSGDPRIAALAARPDAALLFPGPDALDLAVVEPARRPKTLVVVDGTWANARKLVLKDPVLSKFPRVQFTPKRESRYRIRKEPNAQSVSTIEATVEALGLLEDAPEAFREMLGAFDAMVDLQIERRLAREGASRYGRHRKVVDPLRPVRAALAPGPRLVLVTAEADAHAGESAQHGFPRLVHVVLHRWATGETFESFVRPERPLGPNVHRHARVERASIETAPAVGEVLAKAGNFLRSDDVLVSWGHFPVELVERAGWRPAETRDLRISSSEWLHRRPGTPQQVLAQAGGVARAPIGEGRAGVVMGELAGLLDAWARLGS